MRPQRLPAHGLTNIYFKKQQENTMMKPSTKDQIEGKLHEVKGTIKEAVGEATTDPNLEISGNVEKQAGKVQQIIARVEKAVGA
jgi:uncharacterized protein YjbJ (UPF0337 family)